MHAYMYVLPTYGIKLHVHIHYNYSCLLTLPLYTGECPEQLLREGGDFLPIPSAEKSVVEVDSGGGNTDNSGYSVV